MAAVPPLQTAFIIFLTRVIFINVIFGWCAKTILHAKPVIHGNCLASDGSLQTTLRAYVLYFDDTSKEIATRHFKHASWARLVKGAPSLFFESDAYVSQIKVYF